jgi:hypothetical protein
MQVFLMDTNCIKCFTRPNLYKLSEFELFLIINECEPTWNNNKYLNYCLIMYYMMMQIIPLNV